MIVRNDIRMHRPTKRKGILSSESLVFMAIIIGTLLLGELCYLFLRKSPTKLFMSVCMAVCMSACMSGVVSAFGHPLICASKRLWNAFQRARTYSEMCTVENVLAAVHVIAIPICTVSTARNVWILRNRLMMQTLSALSSMGGMFFAAQILVCYPARIRGRSKIALPALAVVGIVVIAIAVFERCRSQNMDCIPIAYMCSGFVLMIGEFLFGDVSNVLRKRDSNSSSNVGLSFVLTAIAITGCLKLECYNLQKSLWQMAKEISSKTTTGCV